MSFLIQPPRDKTFFFAPNDSIFLWQGVARDFSLTPASLPMPKLIIQRSVLFTRV